MTGMVYSEQLGLQSDDVVAIIGSGGKTSLLYRLAAENCGRRVLVSTTTKMYRPVSLVGAGSPRLPSSVGAASGRPPFPIPEMFPSTVPTQDNRRDCPATVQDGGCGYPTLAQDNGQPFAPKQDSGRSKAAPTKGHGRDNPAPTKGVYLFHGGAVGEKIIAPSMEQLAAVSAAYELTLLECDGARERPLKGWAAHEPVVPSFATVTVGVLPLWALGQLVKPQLVHRMERFCQLTGAESGEPVTVAHLVAVLGHPEGLFQKAEGRRVLFLNERAGERGPAQAEALAEALAPAVRQSLWGVLAGDIQSGTIRRIAL